MLQLVIPAFNEERRLPRTLRDLRNHVREHRSEVGAVEIIVVDNASQDRTAEVALAASTPLMPVRVVRCDIPGKGAAVRHGVAASDADIVGFMDADGATAFDAIGRALRRLDAGADVVVGSRSVLGACTEARHSRLREVGASQYRRLSAHVVPGIHDTQCGFKLMPGALARRVFAQMRNTGFAFDVELLARLQRGGAAIEELPVTWTDVPGSTFTPLRHGLGSFASLAAIELRLRRELRSGRRAPAEPTRAPVVPLAAMPARLSASPAVREA